MTNQSPKLADHLSAASWNHLVALMAAHQLPRSAKQTKISFVMQLQQLLTNVDTLLSIVAQLDPNAKEALRALRAADGALPVHTFEERFGPIRPYKPWRKDDDAGDPQPWLAPISTTETLWYRGLIYRDPPKRKPGVMQHYVLPLDLRALLANALDSPAVDGETAGQSDGLTVVGYPGRNGPLAHHLAIWLATVHAGLDGKGVKPVHKRWLPPSVVALLCTRLGLDQEAGFSPIRSERHHPYLAFLHYLALAADLVSVTPTTFQLTPTAWRWLAMDGAARHRQLLDAWQHAPATVAHPFTFRWEPLSVQARAFVTTQLAQLPLDRPIALQQLIEQWHLADAFHLLPERRLAHWQDETTVYDPTTALITGPLHWLGMVALAMEHSAARGWSSQVVGSTRLEGASITIVAAQSAVVTGQLAPCTMPKQPVNTIIAPLNVQPIHLVQLARFCDWSISTAPTARPHHFTLAADRIGQVAAGGTTTEELLELVTAALGRAPSRRVAQRIRNWAQAGQQVTIQPLVLLATDTPERLAQLRRHKLVRNRLGAVIAPNRIALNPNDAPALAQTLRHLGYYVEPPAPETTTRGPETGLAPESQWFLITLYQGLGKQIPLPIALSWTARQAVRQQLTQKQQAAAEAAAHATLERLQAALNGYLQIPAWTMPATAAAEPIIQSALAEGQEIEIRYWGPSDGHVTTRVVTPYWLEERHTIRYLIGWCHLRQQERTFRVDRIEAVRICLDAG